jgi:hypothetical protein
MCSHSIEMLCRKGACKVIKAYLNNYLQSLDTLHDLSHHDRVWKNAAY